MHECTAVDVLTRYYVTNCSMFDFMSCIIETTMNYSSSNYSSPSISTNEGTAHIYFTQFQWNKLAPVYTIFIQYTQDLLHCFKHYISYNFCVIYSPAFHQLWFAGAGSWLLPIQNKCFIALCGFLSFIFDRSSGLLHWYQTMIKWSNLDVWSL